MMMMIAPFSNDPVREPTATARTVDADHGRIETRTATVSTAIAWLQADYKWAGPTPMSRVLHRTLFVDPMLATPSDIDTIVERLGDAVDNAIAGLPKSS